MRMRAIRETIVAGRMIYHEEKIPSGNHTKKRGARRSITPAAVEKNNMRIAVKKVWMLLSENFDNTCSHMTLTYADAPSKEDAQKEFGRFMRRLRREFRRGGQELKALYVTEYENHRIHHHIVLNTCDVELIDRVWKRGFVHSTVLDASGDYHDLAEYMVKETEKTFRLPDAVNKQRYGHTRNLVMPAVKREEIAMPDMDEDPKPIRGYYVPKDRVRTFTHPVTGLTHRVWIELPLAEPRRYKVWPRGKRVPMTERFKPDYSESQVEFEWGGTE